MPIDSTEFAADVQDLLEDALDAADLEDDQQALADMASMGIYQAARTQPAEVYRVLVELHAQVGDLLDTYQYNPDDQAMTSTEEAADDADDVEITDDGATAESAPDVDLEDLTGGGPPAA